MAPDSDEATFTFSWRALKLLGRGLYSNPWTALAELVANGLDAGATVVHVYVDARVKSDALIEVIDNGCGMSRTDIDTYVKVGYDKRKSGPTPPLSDPSPRGRKGIGKLAALYLSPHFYLSTRRSGNTSNWELDARESNVDEDQRPSLMAVAKTTSSPNDHLWHSLESGTRITMLGVDLTGYGPQAVSALGTRLANQFLLPVSSTPEILLWVRTTSSRPAQPYQRVEKSIAFRNLSHVVSNVPDIALRPIELAGPIPPLAIPAKDLPSGSYTHTPVHDQLIAKPQQDAAWAEIAQDVDPEHRTYKGVKYDLTGWIGVHATIDTLAAHANDQRFTKNKYYNPAQIRVYVRGKLASDRLLSQLGLTGTYVNYIEGEVTFNLLDDDSLPDIATSNRQDFDETDKRIALLRALVRPLVRGLMQARNNLASEINTQAAREKARREAAGKRHFAEQLRLDLGHHDEIPQSTRDELQMVITNKIQGDVAPKQKYRVFISHAKTDSAFATLIDELLQSRGARPDEIFFSSRTGTTDVLLVEEALGDVVKRNITDDNTLIFYLTSRNFLASQFCLFEGGAGWATRAVSEYLKLNVDYASIPRWLTNGKGEAVLLGNDNSIRLTPELHNYLIVGVLNPMIAHLNRGRDISGDVPIAPFTAARFPSTAEMSDDGKEPRDYFDPAIVKHWGTVVERDLASYLQKYLGPSAEAERIRQLEVENAQLRALLNGRVTP